MGPTGKVLAAGEIDDQTVTDAFKLQAEALAAGGADALLFETFSDVEEARLAVRAAKPPGLPILVSFAFDSGKNKDRTMMGATPETAARAMAEAGRRRRRGQLRSRARALPIDLPPAQGGFGPARLDQAQRGNADDRGRPGRLHDELRTCSPATFPHLSRPGRRSSAAVAERVPRSSEHW